MKKTLKVIGLLIGLTILAIAATILLTPWMDRWGATKEEIVATFPGDELLPVPASFVNRAVTIHGSPEQIYPWIVQLGAERGGYYSYTWMETYLLNCPMVNADRIHPEWQDLKIGDEVKMCPKQSGPPPYTVAMLKPDKAVVLGHQENGKWVDVWQFVIIPQPDGTSRLVLRSRTNAVGGFWDVIHPGIFIMERGLLLGVRDRVEGVKN
jgi:hypothetical protein